MQDEIQGSWRRCGVVSWPRKKKSHTKTVRLLVMAYRVYESRKSVFTPAEVPLRPHCLEQPSRSLKSRLGVCISRLAQVSGSQTCVCDNKQHFPRCLQVHASRLPSREKFSRAFIRFISLASSLNCGFLSQPEFSFSLRKLFRFSFYLNTKFCSV